MSKKIFNFQSTIFFFVLSVIFIWFCQIPVNTKDPFSMKKGLTREQLMSLPKYDRPDLAALQDFEMTKDPNLGYAPTERKLLAYRETKRRLANNIGPLGVIPGVNWEERGPDNVGGRTRALMFDPNDPQNLKIWAGGISGGLWFTNSGGGSEWTNVDDFLGNLAISCITYDPSNTQNFYIGTGEGWLNSSAVRGAGIWKSTNGGSTWTQLANTAGFNYVQKMVVTSLGTVIAAVRNSNGLNQGILVSTDGGTNWTKKVSGRGADLEIAANGDIYGSIGISNSGALYKSTNDGASWTEITTIPPNGERMEIATAPSNANVVYVVAANGSDVEWFSRSDNGGATWSAVTIPNYLSQFCVSSGDDFTRSQAWYDLILAVHPTNEDIIIAGGIDLYRSTDGGQNWGVSGEPVSYWTGGCGKPYVHADQHSIVFRPDNPDQAIFGNDGGVFSSTNIGNSSTPSFVSRNDGYNVTQFYAVAAKNEASSNYFLAGAQDNGTQKFTSTGINSTTEVTGGDGAFCFIDQDDPTYQITSYVGNSYRRSTNGGASFSSFSNDTNIGRFINPADYDDDANKLYAAGENDEYIRYDGITNTLSTPTSTTVSANLDGAQISHIRVSPFTSNRLFVGTGSGTVFKIDNAHTNTPVIEEITGDLLTIGYISCIELGDSDDDLLLTLSNYGITSVWETSNGGTNWIDKEGNLPDIPVRWALYNPNNSNQVLLATELGVWSTDDISTVSPDWQPTNSGLANVRCNMLQLRSADNAVVVATHGRGIFTSNSFQPVTVGFSADQLITCVDENLVFNNTSGGSITNVSWDFGDGAIPATAGTMGPHTVSYSTPGMKTVKLTINGSVIEEKTDYIEVNAYPQDINVSTASSTVCSGAKVVLTLENSEINAEYKVYDNADDTLLGSFDGNGSSTDITLGAIDEETTFKIIATFSASGCSTELTDKLTLDIKEGPSPEVSQDTDGILSTMEADSYQWFLEDKAIDGATQQTYAPITFGNYSVEVLVDGCSGISDPFDVPILTGVSDLEIMDAIQVFPNPGKGIFYLEKGNLKGDISIKVYNVMGRVFFSKQIQSDEFNDQLLIDLSSAPLGVYFVEVENGGQKIVEKIKKIN